MSRGPGKWQNAILHALEKQPVLYVADILPVGHTTSDYRAILRAAILLGDAGIVVHRTHHGWSRGGRCVFVSKPDFNWELTTDDEGNPRWPTINRLNDYKLTKNGMSRNEPTKW